MEKSVTEFERERQREDFLREKMGQIVKRKKKGRPSKADLARRPISPTPATESEVRRSLRRRNVRYDIDYYEDYFDEEDDDDEEEERRREKKLKLVVKLNQRSDSAEPAGSRSRSSARAEHGSDEEDEEDKPVKKRKIDGVDASESEEEDNYDEEEVCILSKIQLSQNPGDFLAPVQTLYITTTRSAFFCCVGYLEGDNNGRVNCQKLTTESDNTLLLSLSLCLSLSIQLSLFIYIHIFFYALSLSIYV